MRRRAAEKRKVLPDARFHDVVVMKFMNCIMYKGKKSVAETIVYSAIDSFKGTDEEKLTHFKKALDNVKPMLEVKSRRVGGATYQVPIEVRPERAQALAIRWIINAARSRAGHTMTDKLSAELRDAAENKGAACKKREDTHKMAEANRAFAHFRF